MSKYEVGGSQTQFEPGSKDKVLANKLGIIDPGDMDGAEIQLLEDLYEWLLNEELPEGPITSNDLKTWHRRWLGNIYDWAGMERSVNMSKGDFHFAAAAQIPYLLADVMAAQAGVQPLDYSPWDADKVGYFAAIHSGLDTNYEPMKHFVGLALS